MLGRGLLARPDLGLAIKAYHRGEDYQYMAWPQIAELALVLFRLTQAYYPAKHMGNRIKQWLFYLMRTYPQACVLFEQIKRSRDPSFIEQALLQQAGAG